MEKKYKYLTLRKFGWKRIAKNTQRFGWKLFDAEEETTITETTEYEGTISGDKLTITPHTRSSSSTKMNLSFSRDPDRFVNLGSIRILELFYNIFFLIRRILARLLPLAYIASIVLMLLSNSVPNGELDTATTVFFYALGGTAVWLAMIILENIFAKIASKILIYK